MANLSPVVAQTFEQVLREFKKTLSPDEIEDFGFATLADLKKSINDIQNNQASSRRMKNLSRLAPFLEAMEQYDKVAQVFLNTTDLLAFIWACFPATLLQIALTSDPQGPMKFLLETASTYSDSFNTLLDAYQEIGEMLPLLAGYERILQQNASFQPVLTHIYTDIIEFHRSAMKYFKGRIWRQIFQAVWKDFKTRFQRILIDLARHKRMVDSHANLVFLEQLHQDRAQNHTKFELMEQDEARKKSFEVTRWLSAADSIGDHSLACSRRSGYPQTGRWLLQEGSVKNWMKPSNLLDSMLWINGKPGAGKTVLASLLIDECRRLSSTKTAFFYCKNNDPIRNSAIAVFRGLLLQLSIQNPLLVSYLYEVASASGRPILDDPTRAKETLAVVLDSFDSIYLVVDGLDECPKVEKTAIVTWLLATTRSGLGAGTSFPRCCLFSQDDNDMEGLLKGSPKLNITSQHNQNDILVYCSSLAEKMRIKFELSEDEVNDVSTTVSEQADGMFIFARLVMESLLTQVSRKGFRKERKELPADLDQVYERIIRRVLHESEPAEADAAKRTLSWLVCATRPLKWYEIQGAESFDPDDLSFDFEDGKFRYQPKALCGSLIEIVSGEEIRLVHLTAKTYLEHKSIVDVAKQEFSLLHRCLGYLQLPAFASGLSESDTAQFVLDGCYAFMDYAVASWPIHLQHLWKNLRHDHDQLNQLRNLFSSFFTFHPQRKPREYRVDKNVAALFHDFSEESFFDDLCHVFLTAGTMPRSIPNENGILQEYAPHVVSSVSLIRDVIEDIASGSDLSKIERLKECYGSKHFKCPRISCQYFHEGFMSLRDRERHLGKHQLPYRCTLPGCPVEIIGYRTERELKKHNATYHGQTLEQGTFATTTHIPTAHICKIIRKGALDELDAWIDYFEGPLPFSEVWDHKKMSPLRAAYEKGNQDAVAILLDHVNRQFFNMEKEMDQVIRGAINFHNESAAVDVLRRNPFLNDSTIYKLTVLSLSEGLDKVSCYLLNHPNCSLPSEGRQREYFSMAIKHRRMAVVRFMVCERKVNAASRSGGDPFLWDAARRNDLRLAEILLQASPNVKNELGTEAAAIAPKFDNLEFVQAICNAEPRTQETESVLNGLLLFHAARDNDVDQMNRLIVGGNINFDIQPPDKSPLHYAVERRQTSIVQGLIELGSKVDTSDNALGHNKSLLSCAIKNQDVDIVRLLSTHARFNMHQHDKIAEEVGNIEIIQLVAEHCRQIPADVPMPIRQKMMELPEEQFRLVLARWIQQKQGWAGNANVSQPGQQMNPQALQAGQPGGPVGMGGNFLQQNQQTGGMINPAQMQQRLQQELLRRQQQQQSRPALNPQIIQRMDQTPFPPVVTQGIKNNGVNIPDNIRLWGQLKEWASRNPNIISMDKLNEFQRVHYERMQQAQREAQQQAQQQQQANNAGMHGLPGGLPNGAGPLGPGHPNGQAPQAPMMAGGGDNPAQMQQQMAAAAQRQRIFALAQQISPLVIQKIRQQQGQKVANMTDDALRQQIVMMRLQQQRALQQQNPQPGMIPQGPGGNMGMPQGPNMQQPQRPSQLPRSQATPQPKPTQQPPAPQRLTPQPDQAPNATPKT